MLNTSHAVSRTRCAFRFSWLYLISRRYITSRLNALICTLESRAYQLPARTTAERFSLTGNDENENRLFFLFRRNNLINDARTYANIFESTVAMLHYTDKFSPLLRRPTYARIAKQKSEKENLIYRLVRRLALHCLLVR